MPRCVCRIGRARAPPTPCARLFPDHEDQAKGDFVWRDHVSVPSVRECNTSASI